MRWLIVHDLIATVTQAPYGPIDYETELSTSVSFPTVWQNSRLLFYVARVSVIRWPTVISQWKFRISSDLRRQAPLSSASTGMGDCLGILSTVGFFHRESMLQTDFCAQFLVLKQAKLISCILSMTELCSTQPSDFGALSLAGSFLPNPLNHGRKRLFSCFRKTIKQATADD